MGDFFMPARMKNLERRPFRLSLLDVNHFLTLDAVTLQVFNIHFDRCVFIGGLAHLRSRSRVRIRLPVQGVPLPANLAKACKAAVGFVW